jgi:regulatory protein
MDPNYRITQIETQKRNESRVSIFLNGAFAFGLDREVLIRSGLHEGDTLSGTDIEKILLTEEIRRAKEKALAWLSYRDRSTFELTEKLKTKDFSEWIVSIVVADFTRVGLLDDRRFARAFAYSRMARKPVSKKLLLHHLRGAGIEGQAAGEAVEEAYQGRSEVRVALDLARKRHERMRREEPLQVRRKLSDFLARRGFSWDTINDALRTLQKE